MLSIAIGVDTGKSQHQAAAVQNPAGRAEHLVRVAIHVAMQGQALARGDRVPACRPVPGKFVLTAGLGGMGSAQPLAISMAGAVGLVV